MQEDAAQAWLLRSPPDATHQLPLDLSTTVSAEELLAPGYVELGFAPLLAKFVHGLDRELSVSECLLVRQHFNGILEAVIEREMNVLTLAEAKQHAEECRKSMIEELLRWISMKAWRRMPRKLARNLLDSR